MTAIPIVGVIEDCHLAIGALLSQPRPLGEVIEILNNAASTLLSVAHELQEETPQ